jgi:hypothetical protein
MFMSGQAAELRKLELERRMGITPEVKRYNEIKAGVIVSSIGVGLAIFLAIFMQGVAGHVDPKDAEIITRIWVAGVIPFMVGLALIINGLVVSKKIVEIQERALKERKAALDEGRVPVVCDHQTRVSSCQRISVLPMGPPDISKTWSGKSINEQDFGDRTMRKTL